MASLDLQRVLGRNVRELRLRFGLSQEAFGDQVGLHRTYIGGVERGERNLTLQTVNRLGEVLGVEPVALLIDWDSGQMPHDPHAASSAAEPALRAASSGADPGTGARAMGQREGRARPSPR